MRAKVEHTIGVIKRIFGFAKVRYRGLVKNAHRLFVTAALANSVPGAKVAFGLAAVAMTAITLGVSVVMPARLDSDSRIS